MGKIHNKSEEVGLGFMWVPCNVHKKINGRKRYIVTDCDGHILKVKVHKANIHDTKGRVRVMGDAFWKYSSIKTIVADKGYRGIFARYVKDILGKIIHIGNKVGKCCRYVVERRFS